MYDIKTSEKLEKISQPYSEIKELMTDEEFAEKYNQYKSGVPISISKKDKDIAEVLKFKDIDSKKYRNDFEAIIKKKFKQLKNYKLDRIISIKKNNNNSDRFNGILKAIKKNKRYKHYITIKKRNNFNISISEDYPEILITYTTDEVDIPCD